MDDRPQVLPDGWSLALAELVAALGSARFPAALRAVLGQCCGFDSLVVTRYDGTRPPQALFHDLDEVQAAITVSFYATGPYLLDPFYQACRNGHAEGACRLKDLVPADFFRSEYYRSFYRNIRIGDEIGILVRDGAQHWIILSLARRVRRAPFTTADIAALDAAHPVIRAAVLRQWAAGDAVPEGGAVEERLALFGADSLSPREAEIVQLVLSGHSTPTVAAALGISPGTVKVHRRHAYAKLGVTSQSELFSLATRFLMTDAP